jgi:8-oxo-dGTP pyrophosphatase MutT (NUDIX family)
MKLEFSAGGIVYKKEKNALSILLCQHSQHHGWVFPKGLIGDQIKDETREETALREVAEETGAAAKILKPLSPVAYWYVWQNQKIKKTVYYFLMRYVSGDISIHDHEMENVVWLLSKDVKKQLTFKADQKAWNEAQKFIV